MSWTTLHTQFGDSYKRLMNLKERFIEALKIVIDLDQYIHAVAVLINHPHEAANLTFDPPEPADDACLGRFMDGSAIS